MWSLERPLYLLAIFAIPALLYYMHWRPRRGAVPRLTLEVWRGEGFARRWTLHHLAFAVARVAFWIGVVALILAAAGPVTLSRERVHLLPGADVMVVLDESPSMSARDYGDQSRFESALQVIRDFIAGRENDAVGLVTFSDRAALRVPLTTEYAFLQKAIDGLQMMTLGDATAIGMGVGVATLHMRQSNGASRAIILMTDGENNAGEILPETAAEIAAELGIRIYTVGMGRAGDTVLEFTNPETRETSRGIYRGRFDEALLRRVAQATGGRYFAANERATLASIFAEIDGLERAETRTRIVVHRSPRHASLLLVAMILLLIEVALRRVLLREVL